MGKYMRNDKITGDVAVMEVSQASLGVRTRAKTLALQRLQSTTKAPTPLPLNPESCYLQLRSRRLEKSPLFTDTRKQLQEQQKSTPKGSCRENPEKNLHANFDSRASSRLRISSGNAGSVGSVSISCCQKDLGGTADRTRKDYEPDSYDLGVEVSCGENNLEFEPKERSTRESTPCSLIRDSNTIATPGSTTRPNSSTMDNQRIRSARQRLIPTSHEIEEFFTRAERQLQKKFIERYNFDVLNDLPLTGRYDWVRVNP